MYLTETTESIASVAPGLCLCALSKVPIEMYKFLIEVPFAKEESPCPFKYEVSGLQYTYWNINFRWNKDSHNDFTNDTNRFIHMYM